MRLECSPAALWPTVTVPGCLSLVAWLAVAGWSTVVIWLAGLLAGVVLCRHEESARATKMNGREGVAWATWWLGLAWLAVSGYWLLVSGWLLLVDC